jgi:CrcB protein
MIKQLILAGVGGGVGTIFRYLTSLVVCKYCHPVHFPLATFIVNITGCFLIGLFIGLSVRYEIFGKELNLLLVTGFCGGYTTFSTFSLENLRLLETQNYYLFFTYVAGSILTGLLAVWLGFLLAK